MATGEQHEPTHDKASTRREQDLLRELAELGGVPPPPSDRSEPESEPPLQAKEED